MDKIVIIVEAETLDGIDAKNRLLHTMEVPLRTAIVDLGEGTEVWEKLKADKITSIERVRTVVPGFTIRVIYRKGA